MIVGVNDFINEDEPPPEIQMVSPQLAGAQRERLQHLRLRRDAQAVTAAMEQLERAARGDENVVPHILAAVKAYATVGEVSGCLKKVFGAYTPTVVV